jgi:hypothetical protein
MKKIITSICTLMLALSIQAQEKVYSTKTGVIDFLCESKAEKIEATNSQVTCKLASKSGQLVLLMLIKGFKFENSTMEEHFNENYMETAKFPKSEFKGSITNITAVNFSKEGTYNVAVEGNLTIHGVSKKINEKATITVKNGKAMLTGKLKIKIKDFGVKGDYIGSTISNDAVLSVKCNLD